MMKICDLYQSPVLHSPLTWQCNLLQFPPIREYERPPPDTYMKNRLRQAARYNLLHDYNQLLMNWFLHTPQLAISCSIQRGCDSEIHSGYPERMLFNGVDALIKKGKKKKTKKL